MTVVDESLDEEGSEVSPEAEVDMAPSSVFEAPPSVPDSK